MHRLMSFFILLTMLPLALLPLGAFLTVVLVALRLLDQAALPWLWVFAPVWAPLGLSMLGLVLGFVSSGRPLMPPRSRGQGKS